MKSSFLLITSDLFPAIEKMHHIQSDGAGPLSFQLLFEENRKVFNKIMYDNAHSPTRRGFMLLCCSSPIIADYGIVGI